MKIQIEDYFGNDVMVLEFSQSSHTEFTKELINEISEISTPFGYDVADVDADENGNPYIRVQEVNEKTTKVNLSKLINRLTDEYLFGSDKVKYLGNVVTEVEMLIDLRKRVGKEGSDEFIIKESYEIGEWDYLE